MDKLTKQPYEEFPIAASFARNLGDGETLASQSVQVFDAAGLDVSDTITSQATVTSDAEGNVTVMVRGGEEASSPYKISFRCVTSLGNKWEHDVQLKVRDM